MQESTAKYEQYAAILEKRICKGDYAIRRLPTEQEFADEFGISRMTARRALLELIGKGLVVRRPRRRLRVNHRSERLPGRVRLGLLTPAHTSSQYEKWTHAVERVVAGRDASVRCVNYVHWDDPVIARSLRAFDGVLLVPTSEAIPPRVLGRFSESRKLVGLDCDLTHAGVPSVRIFRPDSVRLIGDHLHELGHRRIDCLNVQPRDGEINARIDQWHRWTQRRSVGGRLIDQPVRSYAEPTAKAHEVMSGLLDADEFDATALVCTTVPAANGAVRAMHDHGITVGRSVSVAVMESSELTRFMTPSLTAVRTPALDGYVERCVRWLAGGRGRWEGPLLVEPAAAGLFLGESTGPREAAALVQT
jgi:DNA-binding LacI/PurR family transcriptional regulator